MHSVRRWLTRQERPAIESPGDARLDWQILCDVSTRLGYPMEYESPSEIFDEFASLTDSYKTLAYSNLGPTGKLWPNEDPANEDGPVVLFDDDFPTVQDGARGVHFIETAVKSGRLGGWVPGSYEPPAAEAASAV